MTHHNDFKTKNFIRFPLRAISMNNRNTTLIESRGRVSGASNRSGALVRSLFMSTALLTVASMTNHVWLPLQAHAASKLPVGENTEKAAADDSAGDIPFSISVDGEPVDGSVVRADVQRRTDIDLEKVDIQVKFDGLEVKPALNVTTDPIRRTVRDGEPVAFRMSTNYPDWIERAEVRILKAGDGVKGTPIAVVPMLDDTGYAQWVPPSASTDDLVYVLRVYDRESRYDETAPLGLRVASRGIEPHAVSDDAVAPGEGRDRTAIRNIPVHGGAVTVFGENVPEGYKVGVLGGEVDIDKNRKFVVQRILPPGDHNVDVLVSGEEREGLTFDREIHIPSNDWFYVALADLTLGRRFNRSAIVSADGSDSDRTYTKGRLAFYLKGKIKGKYLLTAAADTKETEIKDMFRGFDRKDPRQLLRRINPDDYYLVYGDESTTVEDAPTSGKFYVRLDRGDSHVMWGNFKTRITGSEFIRNERTLYGANAVYRSEKTTSFGERRVEATAYAAQPGTLPQRDSLRGTGGSAYFLKRQDISIGSEQITVEVRDRISGRIVSRKVLRNGEDYDINYIQGVVILRQPLSSVADNGSLVRDGTLDGSQVFLVANYEYTPLATDIDGYAYGGRAQAWVTDNVRVGITGTSDKTGTADQRNYGADLQIRFSEKTYVEAEIARSEGPGFGQSNSLDGGLLFNNTLTTGTRNHSANAFRVRGQADLADLGFSKLQGSIGAYYEKREAGFSSPSVETRVDERTWGVFADVEVNEKTKIRARYDDYNTGDGNSKREGELNIARRINQAFEVSVGVRYSDIHTVTGLIPNKVFYNGERTDVAGKLAWAPTEEEELYIFGQVTVDRDGTRRNNNRAGIGGKMQLTDKIDLSAEVSYGSTGLGALAAVGYEPTADDRYYFGYRLDPDRVFGGTSRNIIGDDRGEIVFGARRRLSEQLNAFVEHKYDLYGQQQSVTETYGITYTPDSLWSFEMALENGDLRDPYGSDFERTAVSVGGAYKKEGTSARAKLEARFEDSADDTRDRTTWLFAAGATYKTSPNWTLAGNLDLVISQSNTSGFLDGDYVEGSIGYAYRPVDNDRFNALFKYAFLYDLPGPNQVSSNGSLGPLQRSHVVSVDFSQDVNEIFTFGAKYGYRIGEYALDRSNPDWQSGTAHLGIVRADIHVVKNWDVVVEFRALHTPEVETTEYGALAAVYRHVGDNFKVGVGYNFGKFSDDLTDLTLDDSGVFVNVVGKF